MTNEELHRKMALLTYDVGQALELPVGANLRPLSEALEQVARDAKVQAYEEAAREADDYGREQVPPPGASCTDAKYIAMCIRLLKQEIEPASAPV